MGKELIFSGDELELLVALDRTGCVLTDDGKFYCDPEKSGLAYGSRLPVRIRGEYHKEETGWTLQCRVVPAPRSFLIGALFLGMLLCCLAAGSYRGAALFGILNLALVVNYAAQHNDCIRRFENAFLRKTDLEY